MDNPDGTALLTHRVARAAPPVYSVVTINPAKGNEYGACLPLLVLFVVQ